MPFVRDSIFDVLEIVRLNLDQSLISLSNTPLDDAPPVVLSNIAFAENPSGHIPPLNNKVVITLLKVEEEAALKNQPAYRRNPVSGSLEIANPPVFLNIYLLFTANYLAYDLALIQLSRIIGYFQYKRVFVNTDTELELPTEASLLHFDFNLCMVSPSFEQLNHIWGALGGKILPNVMYKLQLVQLEYVPDEVQEAPLIETLELQEKIV